MFHTTCYFCLPNCVSKLRDCQRRLHFCKQVRRNRPPGNFGSAVFNFYTTAPIPTVRCRSVFFRDFSPSLTCAIQCVGVRFYVGKLVELAYLDATNQSAKAGTSASLGYPLHLCTSVRCVVASVHGMDSASTPERFVVASRLWLEGISAEYLAQSGVMASLLKEHREANRIGPGASVR